MANLFEINVYQINQAVLPRDQSQRIGFPTTGVMVEDVSGSATRSLSSGYNVYGLIISAVDQKWYYVQETVSQLATLIG